jgi:mannitol/fructose-specific phosphotransferase system IIA component (Ntr-type)
MKICDLLSENHIFFDLESSDKEQILNELVSLLEERGLVSDRKLILQELLKSESQGSTGLEKGIAVPHALIENIEEPLLALALLKKGINFDAVDQKPTYVLFMLIGDKNNPGFHIKVLARICRLVKETDFVEKVKEAKSPEEICGIFEQEENKII